MKGFIEVKIVEELESEETFDALINIANISGVFPIIEEDMTRIALSDKDYVLVKETYTDVKAKIEATIA